MSNKKMYQKESQIVLQMEDSIDEFMTFSSIKSIGVLSICSVHWVFYHCSFQRGNTGGHIRILKEAYYYMTAVVLCYDSSVCRQNGFHMISF